MATRRPSSKSDAGLAGRIGVRDPFQLIRHLARSQSDPRKAVAELVQNALDEQATHVLIERRRESGEPMLSILDDGGGVLPELSRSDALTHVAKNIGHSRKRQLSFDERMRQAMLGQYGIGILGFWALGHEFRMISRATGSDTWQLTLWEDSPQFEIAQVPGTLDRGETWTEVQVRRLHSTSMAPTTGSRLASYISVELRGQLLRHSVDLVLYDRLARGTAAKRLIVRPFELSGERLEAVGPVPVAGFPNPIELELLYAGDAAPAVAEVKLACAGSVILDRLGDHPEFARPPWTDPRLAGLVDFPHLEVPPGSRRGFVPNEAAAAFARALESVEPLILEKLREKEAASAERLSVDLHRKLARIFSKATDFVPHLEWFPVGASSRQPSGLVGEGAPIGRAEESTEEQQPQREIFPPGPLAEVKLLPARIALAFGEEHIIRARGLDAQGRQIRENVAFEWSVQGPLQLITSSEGRATVRAGEVAGEAKIEVLAIEGETRVKGTSRIDITPEAPPKRPEAGVPRPEEVNEPLQTWRSRSVDQAWQVNVGHPDYRALADDPRRKLRYLAHLLAKEIIARNFPRPEVGQVLEEMVGLLAALDRGGAWPGGS